MTGSPNRPDLPDLPEDVRLAVLRAHDRAVRRRREELLQKVKREPIRIRIDDLDERRIERL